MVADTPGKRFYEQQVKFLLDKDVENPVRLILSPKTFIAHP